MSDLISREEAIKINESHHGEMPNHINHQIWNELKELPPADIMECARAMKSFCWKTDCANCPIFLQCGEAGVRPCDWDLPEGEKGGE